MTNKEDKRYCLYCHTNKQNGKKYFGITCNVKSRWKNGKGYLGKQNNRNYTHPLFARAINKYGWDNFYHCVLFNDLTLEQAKSLEIEYIAKYKTNNAKYGYNCTKGGDIASINFRSTESRQKIKEKHTIYNINQYSLNGKYIKTWYNCYDIERRTKFCCNTIYSSINNYGNKDGIGCCYGYLWKKVSVLEENNKSDVIYIPRTNKKKIYCMDLNCNIIKEYDSIKSASKDLGISSGEIVSVCKQDRKSSHKYRFCYVEDYDNIKSIKYVNNKHRKVLLLDKKNNIIKEYDMIIDLAKYLNTIPTVIQKKLKSKTLYKKQYRICYKEDYNHILENCI